MYFLIGSFVGSMLAALCVTPFVSRYVTKWGLVDVPDDRRKTHKEPTPLSAAIPLLLPLVGTTVYALVFSNSYSNLFEHRQRFAIGLIVSACLIALVGLIDDRFTLRGRQKLVGQFLSIVALMAISGLVVRRIALFGYSIELGLLSVPFTLFWLLGAVNAFNLIDGIDGLATSIGIIISGALGGLAVLNGHGDVAVIALSLSGALCGFLVFNFPPARMFLGDAGSMLIGLVLGGLAIRSSLKGPATAALVVPTAIWALPIFDVSIAILRRKLTGRSLYETDHGHLHHCLVRRSQSGKRALLFAGFLSLLTAFGALISVQIQSDLLAFVSVIVMMLILVLSKSFGHTELNMLFTRVKKLGSSMLSRRSPGDSDSEELMTRFQGSSEWESLWATLTQFATRFDLSVVELNVNLPAIGEEYHARWRSHASMDPARQWRTEIPLIVEDRTVGSLKVFGAVGAVPVCEWMGQLIAGLKPFEEQMEDLVRESSGVMADGKIAKATHVTPTV